MCRGLRVLRLRYEIFCKICLSLADCLARECMFVCAKKASQRYVTFVLAISKTPLWNQFRVTVSLTCMCAAIVESTMSVPNTVLRTS